MFSMPVLMAATYNEDEISVIGKVVSVTADEKVMLNDTLDMSLVTPSPLIHIHMIIIG